MSNMRARFLAIAADPRMIPGVHHHCDEWCQYCPVSDRCFSFGCTREYRKARGRGEGDETFSSIDEAVAFTRDISAAEGVSTAALDGLLAKGSAPPEVDADPLGTSAWEYAMAVALAYGPEAFFVVNRPPHRNEPSPEEIVLWYHLRIYLRVFRALVAVHGNGPESYSSDEALGSAKLVLDEVGSGRDPADPHEPELERYARLHERDVARHPGAEPRVSLHLGRRRGADHVPPLEAGPARAEVPGARESVLGGLVRRREIDGLGRPRLEHRLAHLRLDLAGLDLLRPVAGDEVAGSSARSGGTSSRQRVGWTNGQRVWKRQAAGGLAGLGRSPWRRIGLRLRSTSGSGIGTAESSEIVYGCSGLSYRSSAGETSTILPRYMTAIRSEMWRTTARSCAMKRYVRPNSSGAPRAG